MKARQTLLPAFLCLLLSFAATAQVRLPQLIRASMILQREQPIHIWGWASGGEKISVTFKEKRMAAKASGDGSWSLLLPASKAGGPYTMTIMGKNTITLKDILVGDVWFCSGQSNMEHQMKLHSIRYAADIAGANNPNIRQFKIPNTTNLVSPQADLTGGSWKWANPTDVKDFSAVAYFFAKRLYDTYHVPVGIINASWGGTPIEAWTSEDGLKSMSSLTKIIEQNKDTASLDSIVKSKSTNANPPQKKDKGLTASPAWYETAYEPNGWKPIKLPGYWEDEGVRDLNGNVWYRREINVPASMTAKLATVFLGRIVDADVLYINGKQVGNTTYLYPQRRYAVPNNVLKPGKNLVVIRVTNYSGKGGFVPDKPYCLFAGNDTVDLKGEWQYKVGEVFAPQSANNTGGFALQNQPTALYNAMVAPVSGYTIKGIAWYQGESNVSHAAEYATLQPALIADWRKRWKNNTLPFVWVQLPGFGDYNYLPSESDWAVMRNAQLQSLSVPHTGMAVAIDLGEWNDIHPDRKKEVGDRLALAAEKCAYSETGVETSPVYQSIKSNGDTLVVSFTNAKDGLITSDGNAPEEFAIAGTDKKFVWAKAVIKDNKVMVWNDAIKAPKYVRYAWADNPVNPNVYNKASLPASPFEAKVE